jgi:N-acetylglutamate synthase-like GNAT family acetyltransferase
MTAVRSYRAADLDACRALWVELTEHHRLIYQDDAIGGADPGLQFDAHLAAVGPGHLWVADDDGAVVGLAGLIVDGSDGEVEPVVVTVDRRGEGIGQSLVGAVISAARAAGIRLLSVRPVARNTDAIGFFRDLGFGVLGHVEVFMDLTERADRWVPGETIADREFKV